MDDQEWQAILAVWKKHGFGDYAIDFSDVDDRLVRYLTECLGMWMSAPEEDDQLLETLDTLIGVVVTAKGAPDDSVEAIYRACDRIRELHALKRSLAREVT